MVELVIVIILVGVLGTIAVGRFMDRTGFDTAAWTEQVRSTLRYAQKVAIAQNSQVYVHLTPERIAVCLASDSTCASPDARLAAPGGANSGSAATRSACSSNTWLCEGRPAGVAMGMPGGAALAGSVAFDGLGRAAMSGGFGGKLEIKGDSLTQVVTIDAETGYVD